MIKDAIANNARSRSPTTTAPPKYLCSRKPCANIPSRHGIPSPLRRGLGVVDVNVHYHSLLGLESPKQVLGHLSEMPTIRPGDENTFSGYFVCPASPILLFASRADC